MHCLWKIQLCRPVIRKIGGMSMARGDAYDINQKEKRECPGIGCLVGKNTEGMCWAFINTDWCRCHNAIVYNK